MQLIINQEIKLLTFSDNFSKQQLTKIQFIKFIDMPFAAAISSATRDARRCRSGSEEETRPLNPNRNDYEDIENPFQMPIVVSKLDKKFGRECLINTSLVVIIVIMFIGVMLFCTLVFKNIPFLRIT